MTIKQPIAINRTKKMKTRRNDVPLEIGVFDANTISRFNREHDVRYGWDWRHPNIYGKLDNTTHVLAPPGFDKHAPNQDNDAVIYEWYSKIGAM